MPVKERRVTPKQWIENELKQTISADQLTSWNSNLSDEERTYQSPVTVAGHSGLMSIGIGQDKSGNTEKTVNIAFDDPRAVATDEAGRKKMSAVGMNHNESTRQWSSPLTNSRATELIQGDHPAKDPDYWAHCQERYFSKLFLEAEKTGAKETTDKNLQQTTDHKSPWTTSAERNGSRPQNLIEAAATVGFGKEGHIAWRNGGIESVHREEADNPMSTPGDHTEKRTVVNKEGTTEITRTSQGNQSYYEEGKTVRKDGTQVDIKGSGVNVAGLYQVNKREERTAEAVKYSTSKTSGRTTTGIDREIYKNGTVRETRWTIRRGLFGGVTRTAETRTYHDQKLADRELGGWAGGKKGILERGIEALGKSIYHSTKLASSVRSKLQEISKNGISGLVDQIKTRLGNGKAVYTPTAPAKNEQERPTGLFAGLSPAGRETADKIYRAAHERLTPDQQKDMVASRNEFMEQHKGEGKAEALGKLHDTVWLHNNALTEKDKAHLQGIEEKSFEEKGKGLPTHEGGKWQEAEMQKEADRKEKLNALQVAKSEIKSLEGQPAPVMRAADRAISARMRQLSDDNHKSIGGKSGGMEMER